MARRRKGELPRYRLHKQSGQAVVSLPRGNGQYHDVLLGPFDTEEGKREYTRVINEWLANGQRVLPPVASAELSVNELILQFWHHAEKHYRHADGTPTSELADYKLSLRPLKELYGHTPAKDFGPLALKAVRNRMVSAVNPRTGLPWCRKSINQRIDRIKRLFKWGVGEELVPSALLQGLQAVKGLQKGRTEAREPEPIKPVPPEYVEATLPFLRPQLAAMVQLQLLTGMRPGEVCAMRTIDLDTRGAVWIYRPKDHKTAWRGKERLIAIGPKAQEVLRPWLRLNLEEYLFQPREAEAQRDAERHARRKTPLTPSQRSRRKKQNPKRAPSVRYSVGTYGRAIERAAAKADALAHQDNPSARVDQVLVPAWNPNQLRHNHGTDVRRRYGLEAAQVSLGHSHAAVSEIYAEKNQALAVKIAAEIG
jgi:integrase